MFAIAHCYKAACYHAQQVLPFFKEVGFTTIPFTRAIGYPIEVAQNLWCPSFFRNSPLDDHKWHHHILTPENTRQVAKKFVSAKFQITGSEEVAKYSGEVTSLLEKEVHTTFVLMLQCLTRLSSAMGIPSVRCSIARPSSKIFAPIICWGDRLSRGGPVVTMYEEQTSGHIKDEAEAQELLQSLKSAVPPQFGKTGEFIMAHELTHANHYHSTQGIVLAGLAVIANASMWIHTLTNKEWTFTNITWAFIRVGAVQSIFTCASIASSRFKEMQADAGAMNILGDNEGAIKLFEQFEDNPADLKHPAVSTRLAHAKNWSKKL